MLNPTKKWLLRKKLIQQAVETCFEPHADTEKIWSLIWIISELVLPDDIKGYEGNVWGFTAKEMEGYIQRAIDVSDRG